MRASEENLRFAASQAMHTSGAAFKAETQRLLQNVWQYVPKPTAAALPGEGQPGQAQVEEAIATYTDASNEKTKAALGKLSTAEFETAAQQLTDKKLMRPTPREKRNPAVPVPPVKF